MSETNNTLEKGEILELIKDIPVDELKAFVEERRTKMQRTEWIKIYEEAQRISPGVFKNSRAPILEKAQKGTWFLIERKGVEMAFLGPPEPHILPSIEQSVSSSTLNSGSVFDRVKNGEALLVQRKGENLAALIPPPKHSIMELTEDETARLLSTEGMPPQKLANIIGFARGNIKLTDLL